MQHTSVIPAIWVRFTPYLTAWAEDEFGIGCEVCGRRVLELRTLPGIRQLLRETVDDDVTMANDNNKSVSQLRYEVILSVLDARINDEKVLAAYSRENIKSFLPVHTPDFLQVEYGIVRSFSRTMQLRPKVAQHVAQKVYQAFWTAVRAYDQQNPSFDIDKDMLESFCEEHGIPSVYVEDLRNQYQRLKRTGYYVKQR